MVRTTLEEVSYENLPHPNECDTFDGRMACSDLCLIEADKLKKDWSVLLDRYETLIVNATNYKLEGIARLAERRAAYLEDYSDD